MLEIRDLSARAGSFVLRNVSLSILPSSCHVILGPTGSGKTLLLESVIGLRKPDRGKIFVNGDEITLLPMEKRRLSYVPQDLALFPHMTVRENILYAKRIKGMRPNTENGVAKELIDSLGIEPLLDRRIRNLSGGERQRTALARAIVSGCKYLVLDEPLSALHESLKRELWYLLKDLQGRYELATLMVTHDLEEAFFLGDTISIIIDGRVHQQGTKREIYGCPQSMEVAKFLGIGNLFRARIDRVSGGSLSVRCEDLGANLNVSNDGKKWRVTDDNECILGIRSEDVDILPSVELPPSGANTVGGIVGSILETGASFTIVATTGTGSKTVEIAASRSIVNRLNLAIGQTILMNLPAEHLFLIDANSRNTVA